MQVSASLFLFLKTQMFGKLKFQLNYLSSLTLCNNLRLVIQNFNNLSAALKFCNPFKVFLYNQVFTFLKSQSIHV